ncbi:hypothetical protein FNJ62_08440 [Streptomyces benahoarensis]|uniref:Uncharacterized protein n=1 Tax=Streptomyces benahoarensis TaxID=2595054 RepID=A0A553ZN99_9ACTN|nr:hypothetical protein FNJ62_08440 [Streptomyces benahoarensis]TSB42944.1 hypothetical protein FNZ23_07125 [Streptomyces benahoarensis]
MLRRAAETGAFLAFDGPSRAHHATDRRLPDALRSLADAGHGAQLLLGGDTTTAGARSVSDEPGIRICCGGNVPGRRRCGGRSW